MVAFIVLKVPLGAVMSCVRSMDDEGMMGMSGRLIRGHGK